MPGAHTILHADMDAFYAAVEQRDDPSLAGKPVIVGGLGRRGVVATASYEARRYGVHSALPTAVARRRCPEGVYLRPRMRAYVEVSRTIRDVFESFTPLVEPLSLDEAFLDVTGSRLLFGSGAEIAREIARRIRETTRLTVSIGVATTKYVAKVASDLDKPEGLVVVPEGAEASFLAPLPVKRLWGAGKVGQGRLRGLGLRTIGDVQGLGEATLAAALGEAAGRHFARLCRGLDDRPVVPDRDAKSISHEVTFDRDLTETAHCHAVLLDLAEAVGRRLRDAGLAGRTVRLKLRYPPFRTLTRQCKLHRPTCDDRVIRRTAGALLDGVRAEDQPVRLLGVGVADLAPESTTCQRGLFEDGAPKDRSVLRAIDAIRSRFGTGAIRRAGGASALPRESEPGDE